MQEGDGRVVSNFVVQALRGQELTLYGSGEQTRSFCYVDDLVEGLVRLMAADDRYEPVNLGNPVEFTIKELAEQVSRIVGGEVKTVFRPLPQDDPTQRQPDITRAREWLGWEPRMQLAEGLVRTVAYFRRRLSRRNRASIPTVDEALTSPRLLD
jgi:UDP-glucuronate decarboxylase